VLLLRIIFDCNSCTIAPNMRRKLTPYCTVISCEGCASILASLNRSISNLENRAVIPHPSCGNLILRNLRFAPPCLFGLRSRWLRAFTLSTTFSIDRRGFFGNFFRSTFCLPRQCPHSSPLSPSLLPLTSSICDICFRCSVGIRVDFHLGGGHIP